jgi:phage portal protein BeeE
MGLRDWWRRTFAWEERESLSFADWLSYFTYGGHNYPLTGGTLVGNEEKIGSGFAAFVQGAYKSNGIVFACELVRMLVFSEARFQWREINKGRPGKLFGSPELRVLEQPWPRGTTGDLLTRMEVHSAFGGNSFIHREGDRLWCLRPDWVTLIYNGDPWEVGTDLIGVGYQSGGPAGGKDPVVYRAETVAHYAPIPDPLFPWKGMSWITPVIREIDADQAATTHKEKLFTKGATPNMVVKFDASVSKELFDQYVKLIREGHEGAENAYKTLFLGAGADAQVVGANLRQLDFKVVQGAGETRIANAAGVGAIMAGLSEGLAGSSLNVGNYSAARRKFADGTMRPLWRNVAGSLEWIVNTPQTEAGRAELWYDDRDIAFLQEDRKDLAEIQTSNAAAIRQLIDAGFVAETVVDAVISGDLSRLKHSGLFSVQLQPAGGTQLELPQANGKAEVPALAP